MFTKKLFVVLLGLAVVAGASMAYAQEGQRILTTQDYIDIQQLYARSNQAIDNGDGEAYAATYTEDGEFGGSRRTGRSSGARPRLQTRERTDEAHEHEYGHRRDVSDQCRCLILSGVAGSRCHACSCEHHRCLSRRPREDTAGMALQEANGADGLSVAAPRSGCYVQPNASATEGSVASGRRVPPPGHPPVRGGESPGHVPPE